MSEATLAAMSPESAKSLICERLKIIFNYSPDECLAWAERLYAYYTRVGAMPKNNQTLDPSIKVLVQMWKSESQPPSSIRT